ncbi:hypothetical protein DWB85_03490 [Seongchinamella sediminis]|uniref:Uncharacterized protein n=1 Tax=Seongchinamella sediminis TaxID=2283635 RepID=A0A3L7E0M7_9GAMM|nr:hypothetical protein [Seongchinamella sediminis]RLQ23054.1 hypothetical protein DWB85_03490 [Seongchinamella sediminis]
MNKLGTRSLIYTALAALCALTAAVVGTAAGLWSFLQVVAVTEFIFWLANPDKKPRTRGW